MTDTPHFIPSPCIRHCTLNEQDICVGCGRTLDEIRRWSQANIDDQQNIIDASEERLKIIKNPSV